MNPDSKLFWYESGFKWFWHESGFKLFWYDSEWTKISGSNLRLIIYLSSINVIVKVKHYLDFYSRNLFKEFKQNILKPFILGKKIIWFSQDFSRIGATRIYFLIWIRIRRNNMDHTPTKEFGPGSDERIWLRIRRKEYGSWSDERTWILIRR